MVLSVPRPVSAGKTTAVSYRLIKRDVNKMEYQRLRKVSQVLSTVLFSDPDCEGHRCEGNGAYEHQPYDGEESQDEDSCSEHSSSTSTSTNQKEGKYCDCCYCEFFGHGGVRRTHLLLADLACSLQINMFFFVGLSLSTFLNFLEEFQFYIQFVLSSNLGINKLILNRHFVFDPPYIM